MIWANLIRSYPNRTETDILNVDGLTGPLPFFDWGVEIRIVTVG